MPTRRLFTCLAAAVAAIGLTQTARADFVIDNFAAPSQAYNYAIAKIDANPYVRTDTLANGLTRDLNVNVLSPSPSNNFSASGWIGDVQPGQNTPSGSIFSMDSDNSSTVMSSLNYSGFSGLLSNFSMASAINLAFLNLDSGNNAITTPVTINLITGAGTLSYTGYAADSNTPFTFSANIGDFIGSGDLSNVTGLDVIVNGSTGSRQAADFVMDDISVSTVPAPPAVVLGLMAMPVVGLYRRLRRSEAAV
ncbi:MAG: hypothetical protein LC104_01125 [Bacteroidales bacterium]|nr:hypothetical protein [Bacteroidales bacterium]